MFDTSQQDHTYVMSYFFFFNDTATTEIYTLSLHDALPIYGPHHRERLGLVTAERARRHVIPTSSCEVQHIDSPRNLCRESHRSEEHTSELQSRQYLVCRLLLEKKKNKSG